MIHKDTSKSIVSVAKCMVLIINYRNKLGKDWTKLKLPISDMVEELIGAEVFDIDIDQMTRATINGVAAHLLQIEVVISEKTVISHVDGAPHQRVLADFAPRHAHLLSSRQDFDGSEPRQYRGGNVLRQFQPVPVASGSAPAGLV